MSARLDTNTRARLARLAFFSNAADDGSEAPPKTADPTSTDASRRLVKGAGPRTPEERIERCGVKLRRACTAVDILHASLAKALNNPTVERFRKVDVNNAVFKREVASAAGGIELLYAVGFQPMHGHLVLQEHSPALLSHALAVLDGVRTSAEYREAKAAADDAKARAAAAAREAEAARAQRAAALAKVPAEPRAGDALASCCQLTFLADGGERIARRRFDSENTLEDVRNFVRSLPSVPVGGALRLENVTTRPPKELDQVRDMRRSLYALDLWPVGKVAVRHIPEADGADVQHCVRAAA